MIIISTAREMQALAIRARRNGKRIALVPTMGFLHEGHMSLMRIARRLSDVVVVSSFVNPIQFGPSEDLDKYPRDAKRDDMLCRKESVDVVFRPRVQGMYRHDHSVYVTETCLSAGLCGRSRPGHFRGVTTVVAKLFNIVLPDVAVFGRKDAQQARIIEKMVTDLNFPVRIVVAPTVREPDGLAMSSRNTYLSDDQRRRAVGISRALLSASRMFAAGQRDARKIKELVKRLILKEVIPDKIEYIDMVDYATLKPVEKMLQPALLAVAVRLGHTRLIDNILLPVKR
jgi:pantoate--beta-alanine ligase